MRFSKKKQDAIESYRQKITPVLEETLERKLEEMKREDKFPYNGEWLTIEEIREKQALARKLDRALVVDLMLLYLTIAFSFLGLFWILKNFFLPGT
ncbi:MAG: hypothetical protein C4520_02385 [Candidatus Abyssobacteria bacterium SURF_5]|uniref:Uncharacterized protein n=1 Tax=Abyssobacteria bacterium (strain SURF_5) TaxID=2093360 RepID=A0A3A4P7W2_ABYX5|nr:MAG: hypothetical protein C4520_02385 [Candidatus Abyssubacteria bacterium SURF_5]